MPVDLSNERGLPLDFAKPKAIALYKRRLGWFLIVVAINSFLIVGYLLSLTTKLGLVLLLLFVLCLCLAASWNQSDALDEENRQNTSKSETKFADLEFYPHLLT